MGLCQNVQTYAAAQVFYWSGMNGMDYVFLIFIADTSLMQNRLIWFAWQNTPYIVNTFAGPLLGQRILIDSSRRWGYGIFAIITPVIGLSFWAIFWLMGRRAQQVGGINAKVKSGRTLLQSIRYWSVEFDGKFSGCGKVQWLTGRSGRSPPCLRRLLNLPLTFQSCSLSEKGMEFANVRMHDCLRPHTYCPVRCLGAFLRTQDVLPVSPPEGPLGRCRVYARFQYLDSILVRPPISQCNPLLS